MFTVWMQFLPCIVFFTTTLSVYFTISREFVSIFSRDMLVEFFSKRCWWNFSFERVLHNNHICLCRNLSIILSLLLNSPVSHASFILRPSFLHFFFIFFFFLLLLRLHSLIAFNIVLLSEYSEKLVWHYVWQFHPFLSQSWKCAVFWRLSTLFVHVNELVLCICQLWNAPGSEFVRVRSETAGRRNYNLKKSIFSLVETITLPEMWKDEHNQWYRSSVRLW